MTASLMGADGSWQRLILIVIATPVLMAVGSWLHSFGDERREREFQVRLRYLLRDEK